MSVNRETPTWNDPIDAPWDRAAFEGRLRDEGRTYHDKHPFHRAMNDGLLTRAQIRGWVANRFHYQRNIPIKDAAILSNCPDHEVRRSWVRRILIHDGQRPGRGGHRGLAPPGGGRRAVARGAAGRAARAAGRPLGRGVLRAARPG